MRIEPVQQARYCPHCGTANPPGGMFCSSCGGSFFPQAKAVGQQKPLGVKLIKDFLLWGIVGAVITGIAILAVLLIQRQKYENGQYGWIAEDAAVEFVSQNYPQLASVTPNTYFAGVQGKDFYVVDFIKKSGQTPVEGVRILVDKYLRAVFAYEHIYQTQTSAVQPVASNNQVDQSKPCNAFEIVLELEPGDVTVPPGKAAAKTIFIKNTGTCTWTTAYHINYVGDPALMDAQSWNLSADFPPGSEYGVVVSVLAPSTPGDYQAAWSLRDTNDQEFGQVSYIIHVQ